MELWKEPGQDELRRFLAVVGLPLEASKQKFAFMEPRLKAELKDRILKHSETFGLTEILVNTYLR
jgi:hypothetical protein